MGYPEAPVQDPRLNMPLFPKSSVISILEFYTSLGDLHTLTIVADANVESICTRFQVLHSWCPLHVLAHIARACDVHMLL